MGLMQTETIHVMAEAYDVAMDISFPRGTLTTVHKDLFNIKFHFYRHRWWS